MRCHKLSPLLFIPTAACRIFCSITSSCRLIGRAKTRLLRHQGRRAVTRLLTRRGGGRGHAAPLVPRLDHGGLGQRLDARGPAHAALRWLQQRHLPRAAAVVVGARGGVVVVVGAARQHRTVLEGKRDKGFFWSSQIYKVFLKKSSQIYKVFFQSSQIYKVFFKIFSNI